jgi:6-phosphofructokinase 2
MVLDTSGPALAAAVAEGVDLIKPNLREMRDLTGFEPSDSRAWEDAARTLTKSGKVAVIALTMGHLGAALVTRDRVLRAPPLAITPVNAVGAGDSFLGALICRMASGAALDESFRLAAAAGAAALLNPGTGLCLMDDVKRLAAQVTLTTVS